MLTGMLGLIAAAPVTALAPAGGSGAIAIDLETAVRRFAPGGEARTALDALAADGRLSGVIAIAERDRILFQQAWGMADFAKGIRNRVDTRFNLASIGKMFTAVTIARLAEQGRLSWQDRLVDHVADLPDAFSAITIDHLLSHRSGLGSYFASPLYPAVARTGTRVENYLAIVREERPAFDPGSAFLYSNSGFVLLGAVIERVTGRDFFEVLETDVYRSAGMKRTEHLRLDRLGTGAARGYTRGCFARPPSACTPTELREVTEAGLRGTPAGGGYSTVGDLVSFAHALRSGKLVRPDTLELMTRRHVGVARPGGPIDGYGYGFGHLRIGGRETFGHNGGTAGATAQIDLLKDEPLTIVVLTNSDTGQRLASAITRKALLS
jgi:CubicO group peptidase (beta-lactamase class C family)